jgi:methyl-accepting chemotaxis protein
MERKLLKKTRQRVNFQARPGRCLFNNVEDQPMEKRSLRNMSQTKKFHWAYLGQMIGATLSVVALLYVLAVAVINTTDQAQLNFSKEVLFGALFALTLMLVCLVVFMGVLTAHRIAGPHINMRKTCQRIIEGDHDARIHFRSADKLDDVQAVFNKMLDKLQNRIEELENMVDEP